MFDEYSCIVAATQISSRLRELGLRPVEGGGAGVFHVLALVSFSFPAVPFVIVLFGRHEFVTICLLCRIRVVRPALSGCGRTGCSHTHVAKI